uniref:Uncharacterized protein n=1 Tax=Entomoneis paludosa TaxID=265537 RepID=A0A7S2YR81_9STRA|mmetsp:Transcript_6847/g.14293  ORF Transcript_6847/g.14293 Transcript_6847/m.14293 type:complete len:118 (+) Transcript_6847:35-388(+)
MVSVLQMCSCVEQQAVVDRADCTEPEVIQNVRFEIVGNSLEVDIMPFQVEFNACVGVDEQENDLLAFYQRLAAERRLSDDTETTLEMMAAFQATVVGDDNCPIAMEAFLTNFLLVEN